MLAGLSGLSISRRSCLSPISSSAEASHSSVIRTDSTPNESSLVDVFLCILSARRLRVHSVSPTCLLLTENADGIEAGERANKETGKRADYKQDRIGARVLHAAAVGRDVHSHVKWNWLFRTGINVSSTLLPLAGDSCSLTAKRLRRLNGLAVLCFCHLLYNWENWPTGATDER